MDAPSMPGTQGENWNIFTGFDFYPDTLYKIGSGSLLRQQA